MQTRDATCVFPGHHDRSVGAEVDRSIRFADVSADGRVGATSDGNFGSVCKRGHNGHTHGGWDVTQPSSGTFIWTSRPAHLPTPSRPLLPRPPNQDDQDEDEGGGGGGGGGHDPD